MSATLPRRPEPWLAPLKGLLFPPACLLCNRFMGLSEPEAVCLPCRSRLPLRARPAADTPFFHPAGPGEPLDGLFRLYEYRGGARKLVHRIKLTGDPRAGRWLLSELERHVPEPPRSFDAVVPVPSHRRRPWIRFSSEPAGVWTEALARHFHAPVMTPLFRNRTVPKQTSLRRQDRLVRQEGSVAVSPRELTGVRSVLLADDVITTGATARACALALKARGVDRVCLAAIAGG